VVEETKRYKNDHQRNDHTRWSQKFHFKECNDRIIRSVGRSDRKGCPWGHEIVALFMPQSGAQHPTSSIQQPKSNLQQQGRYCFFCCGSNCVKVAEAGSLVAPKEASLKHKMYPRGKSERARGRTHVRCHRSGSKKCNFGKFLRPGEETLSLSKESHGVCAFFEPISAHNCTRGP